MRYFRDLECFSSLFRLLPLPQLVMAESTRLMILQLNWHSVALLEAAVSGGDLVYCLDYTHCDFYIFLTLQPVAEPTCQVDNVAPEP